MSISPQIKVLLGFKADADDVVVKKDWEKRTRHVCKPCWELKYCPYGPLVEQFPLPPLTKAEAIEHNEYIKGQLAEGAYYDEKRRKMFEEEVKNFTTSDYPEQLSQEELNMSCKVFGHLCPVFFANEPFTETGEMRRKGRYIPLKMKMRVARRDNYTCQVCGKHLRDDEIEYDHIIPFSKGGGSEEHNIRLICPDCNRHKSSRVEI